MHHFHNIYPFSAIVGQDRMKKALLLNAVNPHIGGVLIKGEKGTAKSTAVRGLAALLPEIEVVNGCPFGCSPADPAGLCHRCRSQGERPGTETRRVHVVELPVSATEDKVVGTIDIEQAIKKGEKSFEPGILAEANRNILYVDEVNLLNDHIVDVLLDVAAMGVNIVEREGISFSHPSVFTLIGTMNPEEGDLRPQLLDRFGLCVEVEGIRDPDIRMDVIRRRMAYEADQHAFIATWTGEDEMIRSSLIRATALLPDVRFPEDLLRLVVTICIDMDVDGHRADITMIKTATTIAACDGREVVTEDDVREAAGFVLPHRMRRKPFTDQQFDPEKLEESIRKNHGEEPGQHQHPRPPLLQTGRTPAR